jgi:hypothetical protein
MRRLIVVAAILLSLFPFSRSVLSFCGFYVARGDARLFNKASQVVLVRDANRTVLTMANDFRGDPKEFAIVIPVPTFLEKEQIHVGERALMEHIDAYSAPRLVEYYDENPCQVRPYAMALSTLSKSRADQSAEERAKSLGVKIEASYTVGEYDILILSAKQSDGLETWLKENGYKIPSGVSSVLGSYLKQGMRFFVAKVNLAEQAKLGYSVLRPIQVAYESPKFMLPIRLGMVNADGPQELFAYALTRKGRVETTNYRTVKIPSDMDLPLFMKDQGEFGRFYKDMFSRVVDRENRQAVFLEYAWDMGWCDPCAADPLSSEELRKLGVFWLEPSQSGIAPLSKSRTTPWQPSPQNVFVTRLHVRYDAQHFPEDLVFQETADRTNFQGRYVLRHPWKGDDSCPTAAEYRKSLPQRQEKEAQTLSTLTGWNIDEIRKKMNLAKPPQQAQAEEKWWQKIWKTSDSPKTRSRQ